MPHRQSSRSNPRRRLAERRPLGGLLHGTSVVAFEQGQSQFYGFPQDRGYTLCRRSACEQTGQANTQEIEDAADKDELARSLCYFWQRGRWSWNTMKNRLA